MFRRAAPSSSELLQVEETVRPDDFDANKVAEDLEGTCKSIDDMLPEGMDFEDLTAKDLEDMDIVFQCTSCDWWYEIAMKVTDDGECSDCTIYND